MRRWAVKSAYGTEEVEALLNEQEQQGWSLYYFWVNSETERFIVFFYQELGETEGCKKPDMSLPTGPSES